MLVVIAEFTLRVDVLEHLGSLPPLLVGLNKDSIWADLLDELLSPLSKHSRLIASSHEVDLLAIESLGEMNESALKAVDSINRKLGQHLKF